MDTKKNVNSDSEIMKELLFELRYSALAFSKKLEYKSHSSIDHILKGKNYISESMRDKIIKFFPEVNYWFLKKGQYPIILNEKFKNNQAELLGVKVDVENPDYSLETFATLKNIEKILLKIATILENKVTIFLIFCAFI